MGNSQVGKALYQYHYSSGGLGSLLCSQSMMGGAGTGCGGEDCDCVGDCGSVFVVVEAGNRFPHWH